MHGLHRVDRPGVRQHRAQPVGWRHLGVDEHPDDPDLGVVGPPQDVAEQQQGWLVGRMQVVDHEEDRAARGELVERRRHRLEEAEAFALGLAAILFGQGHVVPQPQHEPGKLGELPIRHARDVVRRERLEVAPQRFGEGLERRHRVLVAATPKDQRPVAVHCARQLRHQARLPMPASPSTRSSRPVPSRTAVHQASSCAALAGTADQGPVVP